MKDSLEILRDMEKYVEWLGGKIAEKETSKFMRFLAVLLFFNKDFMTYTTTIFTTIYVPKRFLNIHRGNDDSSLRIAYAQVLAHEAVHLHDYLTMGKPIYILRYLEPQVLAAFSLLAIGAIWNSWFYLFLLFILCILPIPSVGRSFFEMRGYAMTMAFDIWFSESIQRNPVEYRVPGWIVRKFTGWPYYRMWPFRDDVEQDLRTWVFKIRNGEFNREVKIASDIKRIVSGRSNLYV